MSNLKRTAESEVSSFADDEEDDNKYGMMTAKNASKTPNTFGSDVDCSESEADEIGLEVDIFLENCSSLYNLILDSLHNLTSKTISCECLDEMATSLKNSAKKILAERPDAENSVLLRLNTICCAMEQLRVQHNGKILACGTESDASSSARSSASSCAGEMRTWLHTMEKRLEGHERRMRTDGNVNKLLTDQQALQLEIQREGQILINRLFKQQRDEKEGDSCDDDRGRVTVEAIRKRWHTIYLNSLSLQCRIEDLLNIKEASEESESDPELGSPPTKRARVRVGELSSGATTDGEDDEERASDILPFAESEYESIMDGRTTVTSCLTSSSADDREHVLMEAQTSEDVAAATTTKKWDSVQQDVGYSSGENSIHEALNTCADHIPSEALEMRRKRIECTPVKAFYRTVQLEEMSDMEVNKAINDEVTDNDQNANLSDSMYVNHDSTQPNLTFNDYDEVMALLDEDEQSSTRDVMSESFNTKWREIHGQKKTPRRSVRMSKEHMDIIAKSSRDASSEESSENEANEVFADDDVMSMSFNSACFDTSSPLKRQRSGRGLKNSSFLLESMEMDGSFCSTKSDMPPCKSRTAMRKKLRVRRMPRSMSDGEQLGVFSGLAGLMTPVIRVSPPTTPLTTRSTTRLLRRLDDQLRRNTDSDTAPEQSDAAQAYEWDEYHPPQKDDSTSDPQTMAQMSHVSDEMMTVDEDFTEHFGVQSAIRFVEESRSHLRIVQKTFDNKTLNAKQLKNIELIVKSNLRQVETALDLTPNQQYAVYERSMLRDLKAQWVGMQEKMASPVPMILQQVEKFACTLQEVGSLASLNDIADIRSKEDVYKALDAIVVIERRLSSERDELRDLLASPTFKETLSDLSMEFDSVSDSYEEAVGRIGGLAKTLSDVKTEWEEWSERQNEIRSAMSRIEAHLQEGAHDNKAIVCEMEMCQERMNSLETMCNYLTTSICSLQNDVSGKHAPDFRSELSIYANALAKLRDRFNEMMRVPTPPSLAHPQEPTHRKRNGCVATTQTVVEETPTPKPVEKKETRRRGRSIVGVIVEAVSSSRLIQVTFALSLLSALAAVFYFYVFGKSFGPHITYVNGPPPV